MTPTNALASSLQLSIAIKQTEGLSQCRKPSEGHCRKSSNNIGEANFTGVIRGERHIQNMPLSNKILSPNKFGGFCSGSMANPHAALIEEINRLSNEQIAAKDIWEIVALAIPRGEADAVAKNLHIGGKPISGNSVRSWRNDPNVDGAADPWGRGSPAEHFDQFIDALYSRFPEGAALLLRYYLVRHARRDAIHGRDETLNALEANDEARSLAERLVKALSGKKRQ